MFLTIPAAVCCALACVCLYVAVLTFRLSRASGWHNQRWLALGAVSACAYIVGDVPQTLDVSMTALITASRLQMVIAAVCVMAWLNFTAATLELVNRTQVIFAVLLTVCCGAALVPGGMFREDELLVVNVPWAGITYRMGAPTNLCTAAMVLMCGGVLIAALRLTRAVYRGHREYAWHAGALLGFLVAAVNDALITADVYASVILIDVFYMLPVAAVAMTQTGALVQISLNLERANAELVAALGAAQEATRLKGEFLANVSHELRTPLNSIINVPEGLLKMVVGGSIASCAACGDRFELEGAETIDATTACPSCRMTAQMSMQASEKLEAGEIARHLRHLVRAGRHLLSIVDDILDFTKLDAGQMTLNLESLSSRTLVQDLEQFIAPLASKHKLSLACTADDLTFNGDSGKCMQILLNLVSNAIKFSRPEGRVEVGVATRDGGVSFVVRDYGVGIAPEHHAMIFEAFRQVDGSHTRMVGGTGLGLAVVRKLVDLHGGTIAVESALGQGATFTVWLPPRELA